MSQRRSPPDIPGHSDSPPGEGQPSITPPSYEPPEVPVRRGSDGSPGSRSTSSGSVRPPSGDQPESSRPKRSPRSDENPTEAKRIKQGSPGKEQPVEEEDELMAQPLAKRPDDGGRVGQQIALIANFLQLDPGTAITSLYQYDIVITKASAPEETGAPERKERAIKADEAERNWRVYQKLKNDLRHVFRGIAFAYDRQKILITLNPIHDLTNPKLTMRYEVAKVPVGPDKFCNFKVRITLANKIKMDDVDGMLDRGLKGKTTFVQAIDLILRQHQYVQDRLIPAGRGFFDPTRIIALAGNFRGPSGRVLMPGWFSAVRPIQLFGAIGRNGKNFQLSLNVDVTTSAFYAVTNLIDFAYTIIGNDMVNTWGPQQWRQVERAIKVIRVEARHTGFVMKLKGLSQGHDTALTHTFDQTCPDGSVKNVTIAEYFQEKYNKTLQFPNIPLTWSGPKTHPRFIPIELLFVCKGQRIPNSLLKGPQTAQMIKVTAVKPAERLKKIEQSIRDSNVGMDEISKAFGLKLSMDLMKIQGRVLPPTPISYEGDKTVQPFRGAWDMRNNRFCEGATIKKWACCVCDLEGRGFDPEAVKYFCEELMRCGVNLGMQADVQPGVGYKSLTNKATMDQMFRWYQTQEVDLLIFITKEKGDPIYPEIKRFAEIEYGIMTQIVTQRVLTTGQQMDNRSRTVYVNLCLKINAKMGGINNNISISDPIARKFLHANKQEDAILFIGADVTHPSPGMRNSPSIAALCGNTNTPPTKFEGAGEPQTGRVEIIADLRQMMKDRMKAFYKTTKMKPAKIVFYRDGVSEGQFREVMRKEVQEIARACGDLEPGYRPKVTFIVVQKRHHTRFFKQQITDERDANIPPGTVVDKTIAHPHEFDFYLCSHQGIQGTSKPTKYAVLRDDNCFTSDELQTLTYQLCHLYTKCNRSVSIPAPVYYAHLMAYRARFYLRELMSDTFSVQSDGSGEPELDLTEAKKMTKLNENIKKRMYFS